VTASDATGLAWTVGSHLLGVVAFGAVLLLGFALMGMVRR